MFAALAREMREIDRKTIEEVGIHGVVLMENAGRQVAEQAKSMLGHSGKKVLVLAGTGNNGGDGYVAARYLLQWGYKVEVWLLGLPENIKGDAKINLEVMKKILPLDSLLKMDTNKQLEKNKHSLLSADLVIDAILGTGITGQVTGIKKSVINLLNDLEKRVLAVDIPSGLDADTGQILGCCVQASLTVTFALPKVGLLVYPGLFYVGKLEVVDIGIPQLVWEEMQLKNHLLTASLVEKWIPARKPTSHKGSFGRVLLIAGCKGMAGAACLAALAALKAGAGLVTLVVPESIYSVVASQLQEIMVKPVAETEQGTIALSAWASLEKLLSQSDVVIIGPGLSAQQETSLLVLKIIEETEKPLLFDADALNILATNKKFFNKNNKNWFFTPHPGEMARLTNLSVAEIEKNRLQIAREKAQEWGVTLVLKGARTLLALADGNVYINPTGNPGMATAGSGDVLAGLLGGFLAQKINIGAGIYVHGLAGDIACQQKGELALLASDILAFLPQARQKLKEEEKC